jgi:trimeric autotransporter adhesin
LDPTYDVGMLKGNPDFALYSRLIEDNGVDFAVQGLPTLDLDGLTIPIGIDNKDGGQITFTAQTVNLPSVLQVTLHDKLTQTNTRLDLKDANYTAAIAPGTSGTGRFFLITDNKPVGSNNLSQVDDIFNVNDLHPEDLTIYTIGKTIYIKGEVSSDAKFALYSIDGKLLYNFKAGWSNQNQLDASSFPSRTYILTVTDNNKRKSAKFILGE